MERERLLQLVRDCMVCKGRGWTLGPTVVGKKPPSNEWCKHCHGAGLQLTPLGREVVLLINAVVDGRIDQAGPTEKYRAHA